MRLYCERYTCEQIASLTDMTYRRVLGILGERGITPRSRRHRVHSADEKHAYHREYIRG